MTSNNSTTPLDFFNENRQLKTFTIGIILLILS
ncbi:unnamed protein product, partial [Rotaria magnacalcarata]